MSATGLRVELQESFRAEPTPRRRTARFHNSPELSCAPLLTSRNPRQETDTRIPWWSAMARAPVEGSLFLECGEHGSPHSRSVFSCWSGLVGEGEEEPGQRDFDDLLAVLHGLGLAAVGAFVGQFVD